MRGVKGSGGGRHAGGGRWAKPAKARCRQFPVILQEIAEAVQRAEMTPLSQWVFLGEQARPLSLILYCRSGKTRSVAMATGLHRVFALRGYEVTVVHTESWGGWNFRCGYDMGRCASCGLASRLQPLSNFVKEWRKAETAAAAAASGEWA